jgi:hypothetical protein
MHEIRSANGWATLTLFPRRERSPNNIIIDTSSQRAAFLLLAATVTEAVPVLACTAAGDGTSAAPTPKTTSWHGMPL